MGRRLSRHDPDSAVDKAWVSIAREFPGGDLLPAACLHAYLPERVCARAVTQHVSRSADHDLRGNARLHFVDELAITSTDAIVRSSESSALRLIGSRYHTLLDLLRLRALGVDVNNPEVAVKAWGTRF